MIVAALILAYPAQLAVHELAHAFAVWARGHTLVSVQLLPHRVNGNFYFGRVRYRWSRTPTPADTFWISYAPYVAAAGVSSLWFLLHFVTGWAWPIVFIAAACVDIGRNHVLFSPRRDVTKAGLGVGARTAVFMSALMVLAKSAYMVLRNL